MNDTWEPTHKLNEARHVPCVFVWNKRYIYTTHGNQRYQALDCAERLRIKPQSISGWEAITYRRSACPKRFDMMGIQIGCNEILLFGDYDSDINKQSYMMWVGYDKNDHRIEQVQSLQMPGKFKSTVVPYIVDGIVYALEYDGRLHMYDIYKGQWSAKKKLGS